MSVGFGLSVPPRWYRFDPDDPVAATAAQLDARIAARPTLTAVRQTLLAVLVDLWDSAADQGALDAAALVEPARGGAVVASVVVTPAGRYHPDDADQEVGALLESLAVASASDARPRSVVAVGLPAGRAVRLERLTRTDAAEPGEADLAVHVVQHWIPVADPPLTLVLAGSTPCLDLAGGLAVVFDAIAASLTPADAPTPPGV